MSKTNKKKMVNILLLIILVLSILTSVFCYYCPADYVKTPTGEISLVNGEPYIYHTDLFGNTFIFDNGIRVYVAIPTYRESYPNQNTTQGISSIESATNN